MNPISLSLGGNQRVESLVMFVLGGFPQESYSTLARCKFRPRTTTIMASAEKNTQALFLNVSNDVCFTDQLQPRSSSKRLHDHKPVQYRNYTDHNIEHLSSFKVDSKSCSSASSQDSLHHDKSFEYYFTHHIAMLRTKGK
ncbi:hypothetical protein Tco_1164015 [Tanacetum coccineum]